MGEVIYGEGAIASVRAELSGLKAAHLADPANQQLRDKFFEKSIACQKVFGIHIVAAALTSNIINSAGKRNEDGNLGANNG